ncbi:unnamed protein product (macronuclear) [Paramecium tetraurelia]|uniref:Uncharacterized protein n=1 Tax=Paramecium tetraurelia TaxID=5888 RepID=A0BXZ9_PARTE|nr:uncharacterized protein GSPATT00033269001 [Paramecium tetraurelia]CAK63416.1 unnamed protein product [Paramecium tetraurelia]|eukprot:XP_001430814.1 hypothetical protein (macronuclear) [Paramecium tetraurelia strain d4-2]
MHESVILSNSELDKLLQNLKSIWLPKKEKEVEIRVYKLINLKLEVQSLIKKITEKVNESLLHIDNMINQTKIEVQSIRGNIDRIQIKELKDLNSLKQSINVLLCQQSASLGQQLNNLQMIWKVNILENMERKLKQLSEGDSKCSFDQYFNLSFRLKNNNNWICDKHFEQIFYVNLSENVNIQNRLACKKCLSQNQEYKQLDELQQLWEQNVQQTLGKFNQHQNSLIVYWNKLIDELQRFNKIVYSSSNLKNDILQQQFQLMQKDWPSLSKVELHDIACNQNRQQNQFIFSQIEEESLIKESQLLHFINVFKQFVNQLDSTDGSNQNEISLQNSQLQSNRIELVNPNMIRQMFFLRFFFGFLCYGGWIEPYDQSLRVQGWKSVRKAIIDRSQGLCEMSVFHEKTMQFISGSNDNLIMIWTWDDKRNWYCEQRLEGHTDYIRGGLIMNIKEDLIISGSDDSTIKFWTKNNNNWSLHQTLNEHKKEVKSLSLNDSQNQLISCSFWNEILVTEFKSTQNLWVTIQRISVDMNGYSLCFISDTLFTFQPHELKVMQIYELDKNTKQFVMTNLVKIKSDDNRCDFFPQQFNKEKQVLLHKNGRTINIIKTIDSRQFIPVQYIENCDNYLYGAMTHDAQYLVTWDNEEKEIKIRKYKE